MIDLATRAHNHNYRLDPIIRSLLDGNWTYESAGLLDRDHVQFFTRRDIAELFAETGFTIDEIQYVPGPGYVLSPTFSEME